MPHCQITISANLATFSIGQVLIPSLSNIAEHSQKKHLLVTSQFLTQRNPKNHGELQGSEHSQPFFLVLSPFRTQKIQRFEARPAAVQALELLKAKPGLWASAWDLWRHSSRLPAQPKSPTAAVKLSQQMFLCYRYTGDGKYTGQQITCKYTYM